MKFSVLLSVYNQEKPKYLNEALLSIWDNQTLKPSEIILVKDGPLTSELDNVVEKWKDKLNSILQVISIDQNRGLAFALNEGLKYCSYELVARMDTDDISLSNRFQRQVSFMKKNSEITVSSAWIQEFSDSSKFTTYRKLPIEQSAIKEFAKVRNPISHPASIFRKREVLSVGGYPNLRKNQDYALWSLLLVNGHKLANLPVILLKMRVNQDFWRRRGYNYLKNEIKLMQMQKQMGLYGWPTYFKNLIIRSILRLSPDIIKKLLYLHARD